MAEADRRWHLRRALALAGMVAALLVGAAALPSGCLVQTLAGLPCPGCGLSSAVAATVRGDLAGAAILHPLGPAVAAMFLLLFLLSAAQAWRPARTPEGRQRALRLCRSADRLLLAGLAGAWLWRLAALV